MSVDAGSVQFQLTARDTASATVAGLQSQLRSLQASLQGMSAGIGEAGASAERSTGLLGGLTGGLAAGATAALGFTAALVGIRAAEDVFGALKQAAIGFNGYLEQSTMSWSVFLKNTQDAQAMVYAIEQFAAKTPFRFQELDQGARTLAAMGVATGQLLPELKEIANVAAASPNPGAFERISYALAELQSMGRVDARIMRELTMDSVPAWNILAETMGKSVAEVRKLSEEGKISSDTFMAAFAKYANVDLGGMLDKQVHTFRGALTTIQDSLTIVASTAFKPLFDRISELAQRIADFTSSSDFQIWGAHVAAVVEVVLQGLGILVSGFASAFSEIVQIATTIGQMVYAAFSWLDPTAHHSPSLVERVGAGAGQIRTHLSSIGAAAKSLGNPMQEAKDQATALGNAAGGQAGAFANATSLLKSYGDTLSRVGLDQFKQMVDSSKASLDDLKASLSAAQDQLRSLASTPIQGMADFDDRIFGLTQRINAISLQEDELKLGGARGTSMAGLNAQLNRLNLQKNVLELQKGLKYDPEQRAIARAANPTKELPFDTIVGGIQKARSEIEALTPAVARSQAAYDAQSKVLQGASLALSTATAQAKAMKGAVDSVAQSAAGGLGTALDGAKKDLKAFQDEFAKSRDTLLKQVAPAFDAMRSVSEGLATGLGRVNDALQALRNGGSVWDALMGKGGPETPTGAVDQMRIDTGRAKHQFGKSAGTDVGELAQQLGDLLRRAFDSVDWDKIGHAIAAGMQGAMRIGLAEWHVSADLTDKMAAEDWTPTGEVIGQGLFAAFLKAIAGLGWAAVWLHQVRLEFQRIVVDVLKIGWDLGAGVLKGFVEAIVNTPIARQIGDYLQAELASIHITWDWQHGQILPGLAVDGQGARQWQSMVADPSQYQAAARQWQAQQSPAYQQAISGVVPAPAPSSSDTGARAVNPYRAASITVNVHPGAVTVHGDAGQMDDRTFAHRVGGAVATTINQMTEQQVRGNATRRRTLPGGV